MNKISRLKNPVQQYAWGSRTAIHELLGKRVTREEPIAELWMGAHPKAPSKAMTNGNWECLDQLIEKDPESILGKNVAEKFNGKLPFLFKILAAERPLSIQVHPNIRKAREGFERENRLHIALDAPNRNYKDDNHKPEVLCALTPFQCLKGFRKIAETLRILEKLSSPLIADEFRRLRNEPDIFGLKRFFSFLMAMEEAQQQSIVAEVTRVSERYAEKNPDFECMASLNREFPGDIGALAPAFFNLMSLDPGEAIFLPPGMPHAYLQGVGIELMANSDNVLRGGLTQKHMDIPELLRVMDFSVDTVEKIEPETGETGEILYPAPAEEFILSVITLRNQDVFTSSQKRSADILICLEGEGSIKDLGGGDRLPVKKGQSFVVPAAVLQYRIEGDATLYKAAVPPELSQRRFEGLATFSSPHSG